MSHYIPNHDDLVSLGFKVHEWEGIIYSYSYQALTWHSCRVDGSEHEGGPHWTLSSWHTRWYPRKKEDVERLVMLYTSENQE